MLDENGKPTDNGTPNAAFAWSVVIKRIKYNKNHAVDVFVTSGFKNLSKEEKSKVAMMGQNKAMLVIGEVEKFSMEKYRDGLYTSVYNDGYVIGKSKTLNFKEFKWNND